MQPSPSVLPVLADVAIKLADEGVPIRAIARSVRVPSDEVYELLRGAVDQGRILELPKDDWPPGKTRNARTQVDRAVTEMDDGILHIACSNVYKLTRLQSIVFLTLLRRPQATKAQLHNAIESARSEHADPTDQKMVDVVICHIRKKLKQFSIANGTSCPEIKTAWGVGYQMDAHDRDACIAALEIALKDVPA